MITDKNDRTKLDGFLSRSEKYVAQGKRSRERNLHLGIDYGTSSSKLVLTDYSAVGGELSFVVRPSEKNGGDGGFRIPSSVSVSENWLRFGFQAESSSDEMVIYRSLKMMCAYPEYHSDKILLPRRWSARDLVTLYVGHLIQLGQIAAERYANRFEMKPQVSLTMGAPMSFLDNPELSVMFVGIVREALWLSKVVDLLDKIAIDEARDLLSQARNAVSKSAIQEPRGWVRSEAEAALFWAYRSPEIDQGRYACVDVGAGTTSASWFHITAKLQRDVLMKERMVFYGTACNPPACDAIGRGLLSLTTDVNDNDIAQIRGLESQIIEKLSTTQMESLDSVLNQIGLVFAKASQAAYRKDALLSHWTECGARIFFLGGGSKIDVVRRKLVELKQDWLRLNPEADPGVPEDLKEQDGSRLRADPTFLLVAYGLARRLGDVPFTSSPSELDDFKPEFGTHMPIETEHLYSD